MERPRPLAPRLLLEIVAVKGDGRVGSERAQRLESRRVAPDGDHPARAEELRDLDGDRPDASCCAEHEHDLPGANPGEPRKRYPGRKTDLTQRGRNEILCRLRNLDQNLLRNDEAFAEGAVTRDPETASGRPDARPGREAGGPHDPPHAFDPGNVRQRRAPGREASRRDREVGRIESGREQLDDRLAFGGFGLGALADLWRGLVRGDDRGAQTVSR